MNITDACEAAAGKNRQAVDSTRHFPRNVFRGEWAHFLFFDSDWMREAVFVEYIKAFLQREGGTCACLENIDQAPAAGPYEPTLFIHSETSPADYAGLLMGDAPGQGWVHGMGRLTCSSNIGDWAMYCEPVNEMAVVALRGTPNGPYTDLLARLHAEPIHRAIAGPGLSYGFSVLPADWREALLSEYALP